GSRSTINSCASKKNCKARPAMGRSFGRRAGVEERIRLHERADLPSFPNSVWERTTGDSVSPGEYARETEFRGVRSQMEVGNEAKYAGRHRSARVTRSARFPRAA